MPRKLPPVWVTRESVSKHGLTSAQRDVLLCLWDHADDDLTAWPSVPTINAETGWSVRWIKASVLVLWQRGFIRRQDGRQPDDPSPDHSRRAVRWIVQPTPPV